MAELIANILSSSTGVITSLGVSISSTSATSITTSGAAPTALQGGQFRIRIDNEIMLVTAGQSGISWTVTRGAEGSTAATHVLGSAVRHVITAGAIQALLSAQSGSASVANCLWSGSAWTYGGTTITARPSFAGKLIWLGGGADQDPTPAGLGYATQGDLWVPSEDVT